MSRAVDLIGLSASSLSGCCCCVTVVALCLVRAGEASALLVLEVDGEYGVAAAPFVAEEISAIAAEISARDRARDGGDAGALGAAAAAGGRGWGRTTTRGARGEAGTGAGAVAEARGVCEMAAVEGSCDESETEDGS